MDSQHSAPGVHPGASSSLPEDPSPGWVDAIHRHDDWLAAADHAPGTRRLRAYWIARFAATSGVPRPWAVSIDDVARFLARPDWSPETRKSARNSLRSFYSWGVAAGWVDRDPTAALPRIRIPTPVARPTPTQRVNRALAVASDRDRLMIMLGVFAGLRAAEIARIDPYADVVDGVLWVLGKGDKTRRVPLHSRLQVGLEHELGLRARGQFGSGYRYGDPSSRWLFPGQRPGEPITPGAVGRILKRNLGERGHGLRSRFMTTLHERGVSPYVIKELVGHASVSTLQPYLLVSDVELRKGVQVA